MAEFPVQKVDLHSPFLPLATHTHAPLKKESNNVKKRTHRVTLMVQ